MNHKIKFINAIITASEVTDQRLPQAHILSSCSEELYQICLGEQ